MHCSDNCFAAVAICIINTVIYIGEDWLVRDNCTPVRRLIDVAD